MRGFMLEVVLAAIVWTWGAFLGQMVYIVFSGKDLTAINWPLMSGLVVGATLQAFVNYYANKAAISRIRSRTSLETDQK